MENNGNRAPTASRRPDVGSRREYCSALPKQERVSEGGDFRRPSTSPSASAVNVPNHVPHAVFLGNAEGLRADEKPPEQDLREVERTGIEPVTSGLQS
jgi:hypothetical protein